MYDAKKYNAAITSFARPAGRFARNAALCALLITVCGGCAAPSHAATMQSADALNAPDAQYEVWEQHWTLNPDGTTVYREKTHLRLNSDRTYDDYGDPRTTFNKDTDTVKVITARTRMSDGTYVELADYSTVEVAADASAGWPAFGGITQMVQVMGGIDAGCMLEREYQITTKPGVHPYLAADVHVDNRFPVLSHTILVSVPGAVDLSAFVSGIAEDKYVYSFEQSSDDLVTHRWDFTALEAMPEEPHAAPWQTRGIRLAFTTAPDALTWLKTRLNMIDSAADESTLVSELAQKWTEDAATSSEKFADLQEHFSETFNFLSIPVQWRPAMPRKASDTLNDCYGVPSESAAALLALARASGLAAKPALLVNDETWCDRAPQAAMSSSYVLLVPGEDGDEIWCPRNGLIRRDGHWAGYTALSIDGDKISKLRLPAWTDADASRCRVTGAVSIDEDGKLTGDLVVKTTGMFVSPGSLDTADGQRRQISRIVNHVLAGAEVKDFTLKSLAEGVFEAEVKIASDGELDKLHDFFRLEFAQTSPALDATPIPVQYTRRETPARLTGPFDERIEITVEWPEDWRAVAAPAGVDELAGDWGVVSQTVEPLDNGFKFNRHLRINKRTLPATAVVEMRKPLNELSSDYARTLLLEK